MNDLILSAKFRELEGEWITYDRDGRPWVVWDMLSRVGDIDMHEFCPIRNLALNCAARDKYGASVNYQSEFVSIGIGRSSVISRFSNKLEIKSAVIECILKSEGKL